MHTVFISDIDDCIGVDCLNGGSCIDRTQSYICKCVGGFEGRHCETDVDIKFNVNNAFLESPPSSTLKVDRLENQ
jgi:hypothetical protein